MLLCEGMLSKITLLIKKEMRKLFRTSHKASKDIHRRCWIDAPVQLRSATKFLSGIELFHNRLAFSPESSLNQPKRNVIADIINKLHKFLSGAPTDFTQLVGTDIDVIRNLIEDDNYEDRFEFLGNKLEEIELFQNAPESSGYMKFIQKSYKKDAKRTLDWFILSDDSPECAVTVELFEETYGSTCSDAATLGDDHDDWFKLDSTLSNEDNDVFRNYF